MNKVVLIGRVGKDAETVTFDSGKNVTSFSLATTTTFSKENQRTDWHNIKAWGDRFHNLSKYITKGRELCVEGRIENGSYEKDGVKVYYTDIIADNIELIGGTPTQTSGGISENPKQPVEENTGKTQVRATQVDKPSDDGDGLPF